MILGVAGLVKGDWNNINVSVVKKVKSLGFKKFTPFEESLCMTINSYQSQVKK